MNSGTRNQSLARIPKKRDALECNASGSLAIPATAKRNVARIPTESTVAVTCNYLRVSLSLSLFAPSFLPLCLSLPRESPFCTFHKRIVTCACKRTSFSLSLSLSCSRARRPSLSISRDECRDERRPRRTPPTHETRFLGRSAAIRDRGRTVKFRPFRNPLRDLSGITIGTNATSSLRDDHERPRSRFFCHRFYQHRRRRRRRRDDPRKHERENQ